MDDGMLLILATACAIIFSFILVAPLFGNSSAQVLNSLLNVVKIMWPYYLVLPILAVLVKVLKWVKGE